MKKQIRMIGLDLDGTLLTGDKELTNHTKNILLRAIEQGVIILPATGRPLTGIPEEILQLPGIQYALTANGARIINIKTNEIIFESLVPVDTAKKILDVFEKYDTIREIYYDGVGYVNKEILKEIYLFYEHTSMADYILRTRKPVDDIRIMMEGNEKSLDKVQGTFRKIEEKKMAEEDLKAISNIEVTGALINNIEVNFGGVNKGKGLICLGKLLGIKADEIMAFGDGMNDVEMLKEVGFSIAMENGVEDAKKVADYITCTNDEDGVAKAIEKFVLK